MDPNPLIVVDLFMFILKYKESHDGNSPTYREMAKGIGVKSTNTVWVYIQDMIKADVLEVRDKKLCVVEGKWSYEPEE